MKQKILQALKREYKNLGVSEGAFDGVALMLSKTITEESAIEDGVKDSSVSSLLKSIQSDVDRERTEKNRLRNELDKLPKPQPQPEPQPSNPNDELIKQIKEMREEMAVLRGEKIHETTSSKITALLREKKVPDVFINMAMSGRTFDSKFNVDEFVAQTSESFDKMKTEFAGNRFEGNEPPEGGKGGADSIDSFVSKIQEGTKELTQSQKS